MNKHKHYDCIIAWAEGKKIEYKWDYKSRWYDTDRPIWNEDVHYRIKPEPVTLWVNEYEWGLGALQDNKFDALNLVEKNDPEYIRTIKLQEV